MGLRFLTVYYAPTIASEWGGVFIALGHKLGSAFKKIE